MGCDKISRSTLQHRVEGRSRSSCCSEGQGGCPLAERVRRPTDSLSSVDRPKSGAVIRAQPSVEFLPIEFDGRHVGVLTVDSPGERDEWELHPDQDGLLYLLEGEIDVFIRPDIKGSQEDTRHFRQGEACLNP